MQRGIASKKQQDIKTRENDFGLWISDCGML
jgi:hypothetical protein